MRIIWRKQWGARYGDGYGDRPLPATEAWLHHSVTIAPGLQWVDVDGDNVDDDEEHAMRTIEDIGAQRFGSAYGFPYTFAVMPRGDGAYAGHAVGQMGAHTYGHNDEGIGIVLVGNYEDNQPTDAQLDAVAWLLVECKRRGWLRDARLTGGHRDVKATACPGRFAYESIDEINRRAAAIEEDDMTPEQAHQLATIQKQVADLHSTYRKGVPKKRFPGVAFRMLKVVHDRQANMAKRIGELQGEADGLREALRQHAEQGRIDVAQVEAASVRGSKRGTIQALQENTVDVDITVQGKESA